MPILTHLPDHLWRVDQRTISDERPEGPHIVTVRLTNLATGKHYDSDPTKSPVQGVHQAEERAIMAGEYCRLLPPTKSYEGG